MMTPLLILIAVTAASIGYLLAKPYLKARKRDHIASQPFPKAWREVLKTNLPYFYKMPADLQLQLKRHIQIFLAEKHFQGFEGLQITDEIRVTIAAQACLLLLNRDTDYYPNLQEIYVYPAAFVARHSSVDAAGVLQQNHRVLSGESWGLGKVILSWRDSQSGGRDFHDGHNVVIHEFAHQLDQETGAANGAPRLTSKANSHWPEIFSQAFQQLGYEASRGLESLLDYYGATNPAEFFAVASEVFYEKPQALQHRHPQLYEQLKVFYHVDPAIW